MSYFYQYRNLILVGVLSLTIILLITVNIMGNSQDEQFLEDQQRFEYAEQFLTKDKPKEALLLLKSIEKDYPDNHLVMWYTGWALMGEEKHEQALNYYIKAQDLNPVLTRRPVFLNQLSTVLIQLDRNEEAEAYIARSKELSN